jgi:hypothetical protein
MISRCISRSRAAAPSPRAGTMAASSRDSSDRNRVSGSGQLPTLLTMSTSNNRHHVNNTLPPTTTYTPRLPWERRKVSPSHNSIDVYGMQFIQWEHISRASLTSI